LNQVTGGKLSKVISAKITNEEYGLLATIAKDCYFKYRVINQPTITAILRYLVRNCIKTRFPQYGKMDDANYSPGQPG
jgi:hypothetical protein